jgi:hypothetical protein
VSALTGRIPSRDPVFVAQKRKSARVFRSFERPPM